MIREFVHISRLTVSDFSVFERFSRRFVCSAAVIASLESRKRARRGAADIFTPCFDLVDFARFCQLFC